MKTREDIIRMIEEEGVEFIRLQFTDIYGRLKNIAVTPGQMSKVFDNKYSFDGDAAFGNMYGYEEKLYLYPDMDSFIILPWRPQQGKVAKIVCDIKHMDGTPFEYSSRQILKNVLKKAADEGYTIMADPECEFFLFHTDDNGLPTTTSHENAGYMEAGPSDFGENARRDIVLMLEDMGFEIESSHHESAPAQHEIDFKEEEALKTADSIQTFRFAVRSIAKRFGLYATFMPKPKTDVAGSGMHTNFTVCKDGKNIFRTADGTETDEALYFIGGIIKHAKALSAIANPTVNSYKRLLNGYDPSDTALWSRCGESTFIKLNNDMDDTKVELRFPDGASNPYLLFAATVSAGLDGIRNRLDPGKAGTFSDQNLLPEDLREALYCLDRDEIIKNDMGVNFVDAYIKIKTAEWKAFMKQVSEWEIDTYLGRM